MGHDHWSWVKNTGLGEVGSKKCKTNLHGEVQHFYPIWGNKMETFQPVASTNSIKITHNLERKKNHKGGTAGSKFRVLIKIFAKISEFMLQSEDNTHTWVQSDENKQNMHFLL